MRYLHPVAASERFIAKGVYRFYERGALLPSREYIESWTRHAVAGGGILTRIDQERRNRTTLMEVLADENSTLERLHVREWTKGTQEVGRFEQFMKNPPIRYQTLRADYIFFPNYAQMSRRLDDNETITQEMTFPGPLDAVALWRISTLYDGQQAPLRAQFHLENKPMTTFEPQWRSNSLGEVTQAVPLLSIETDETHPSEKAYNFGDDCLIFLNQDGFMSRVTDATENNAIVTILTEYAHI